jgi:uncharacterized protein with ATP-grasp and redox domains
MKTHLECIPCFIKQSIEAASMVTNNEQIQIKVLNEVMKYLQNISFTKSPPEHSKEVHHIIKKITKINDPYRNVKAQSNEMAKKQYPNLKKLVDSSDDPLRVAIKLAIIGNVIDFGTMNRLNVDDMIDKTLKVELDTNSYSRFNSVLKQSETILYISDNTGEIFFDKILLEELVKNKKKIYYVVKSNPIINDATKEDAYFAGIDKLVKIIEGDLKDRKSAPGIILSNASKTFLDLFESSDMVISKGQGNFECLSNVEREVFFLLVIKCPLVAEEMGNDIGTTILKVN